MNDDIGLMMCTGVMITGTFEGLTSTQRQEPDGPQTVTVRVLEIDCGDHVPHKLGEFIAWAQRHLESIPPEFRDGAEIYIKSGGDYCDDPELRILYDREETAAEYAARLDAAAKWEAAHAARTEAQERAALALLQAKYEGKAP